MNANKNTNSITTIMASVKWMANFNVNRLLVTLLLLWSGIFELPFLNQWNPRSATKKPQETQPQQRVLLKKLQGGSQSTVFSPLLVSADWDSWWTYEGISGPDFWGRLNPKWSHCSKGRRQSPINIDTTRIIYDSNLSELSIKGYQIDGQLSNTGRSISLTVSTDKLVLISGGPLSYQYTLSNVTLHFGRENNRGSEHTINGVQFAGELQLYAYNGQLYSNWSEAKRSPNGLVAIGIFIKVTKNSATANSQLKQITNSLKNITNRGDTQEIYALSVQDLLPSLTHFVTYDGSLTQPDCFETVNWIILNKPIYMSSHQFHQLRTMLKGDGHQDNFRPIQPLNQRTIRANIENAHFERKQNIDRQLLDGDIKSSEEISLGFSKDICYVNRPVAYKMNQQQMEIDI